MVQKGPGFNFLYITAWFNLTWDFCGATVLFLTATTSVNGKSQGRGKRAREGGKSKASVAFNAWKFKFLNENINSNKSKSHLPAARRSTTSTRNSDLPDWYNFIKRHRPRPSYSYNAHFQPPNPPPPQVTSNYCCFLALYSQVATPRAHAQCPRGFYNTLTVVYWGGKGEYKKNTCNNK